MKKIIHVDMDAYYAAIEIRENPSLKGKPVIVGGSPNSRGVVSTCSYEARVFGVHSGMASSQAWRLCPQGVFVYPHFQIYKEVSATIRDIFYRYSDIVEPMSLDEAYIDVTENKVNEPYATEIAKKIKADVLRETSLTCSAGVSYNKFLAKIGSELQKPDGLVVIPPRKAQEILFKLPIEKYHGIGKVTAARMNKLGVFNGADLYQKSMKDLMRYFGKAGLFYYYIVRGIDNREIITEHEAKSISNENTFHEDIDKMDVLLAELQRISEKLANRMMYKKMQGQSIVLKVKYDNFEIITRSASLPQLTNDDGVIFASAKQLFLQHWDQSRKIRLLGIGINNLDNGNPDYSEQLVLPFYTDFQL
ncbi:MAG: DNA polymerase IV [Candidatus Cloacimonetes bacterium HGW-Cloacimonetes-1]|jgi:DNA polymerase-4|nr:MAG: DNA polymerase IV [Candidatus Cloacimonetes bacterium HGW-Cloacimonetes-1]